MGEEKTVFGVAETHGRALRRGNALLSHSDGSGWCSLYAATFREGPFCATEPAIGHPSLIYHLARPTQVVRKIDGVASESAVIGPGRFCLTPGDASAYWQHSGEPEILQLYLRRSIYEAAAEELFGGRAAIVPRFAVVDPLLEQLVIAVAKALRDGSADDRLYVETIAQLVAVHLARVHSSRSRMQAAAPLDRLSQARTRHLLDYIEQHLADNLSLAVLAAQVSLSPLYLVRAFRAAVGQPPHRYVVERRIDRARRLLATTQLPVAEIALATGFSSQSHLTNWFRRVVGVSPAAYRKGH
jgi:AraC family transcriptional regulator